VQYLEGNYLSGSVDKTDIEAQVSLKLTNFYSIWIEISINFFRQIPI
jgi:hypothetical protein